MLTSRVIPCLDIRDDRVVKGVRFANLRDAGDPVQQAQFYEAQGADELVILDVSATVGQQTTTLDVVRAVRARLSLPLTIGGGIRCIEDALSLLRAGADKVAVNTVAVERPEVLSELAAVVGRQCVVLACDAAQCPNSAQQWEIVTRSGTHRTGIDIMKWVAQSERLGVGEVLLTSWDRDGTQSGYDLELLAAVRTAVDIPIIASGGASSAEHMIAAFNTGADAVLAASIFHDSHTTVHEIKTVLAESGVEVRI